MIYILILTLIGIATNCMEDNRPTGCSEAEKIYIEGMLLKGKKEYTECTKKFKKAADLGFGPAQYELGRGYFKSARIYANLRFGSNSHNNSFEVETEFFLGKRFYDNNDMHRAFIHLKKASSLGNISAIQLLADIYFEKAENYLKESVKNNYSKAEKELVLLYDYKSQYKLKSDDKQSAQKNLFT